MSFCPTGKQPHPTKKQAQDHLKHLKDRREGYSGRAFYCKRCNLWHVGRPVTKKQIELARRS